MDVGLSGINSQGGKPSAGPLPGYGFHLFVVGRVLGFAFVSQSFSSGITRG